MEKFTFGSSLVTGCLSAALFCVFIEISVLNNGRAAVPLFSFCIFVTA
ncbi:hypothetical protein DEU39_1465 [Chryseobacterium sp. AG363]|nr:hypothetical protein DEU39_1465 [Chryseobacterium sp. AG363]